jgi:hypothetical protein
MNRTTIWRHGGNDLPLSWPLVAFAALLLICGCATSKISPDDTRAPDRTFCPVAGSHEFQPRSVPATITHDSEEALVAKGYCKLGTVKVEVNKHDRDHLSEILLKEAAAHGGDLIRPTVEAEAFREADRIVNETMGEALQSDAPQNFNWHADGVPDDPHARPVQWGGTQVVQPKTIYQKGAQRYRSEGTVWRHAPAA